MGTRPTPSFWPTVFGYLAITAFWALLILGLAAGRWPQ